MVDLLSAADRQQFTDAIKDVTDTFFQVPVVFRRKTRRTDSVVLFNEEKSETTSDTDFNLLALEVKETGESNSESEFSDSGAKNVTESYLLFNFADLNTQGLISANNEPEMIAGQDTFVVNNREYVITGVNVRGPIGSSNLLVRVDLKRFLPQQDGS